MTYLQLCLPYWGIHYIDRSLSHTIGTSRCWLSLGALSKLFLKAAWAVLTHSPSISTYAKEKTTAISSTKSSGAQVSALFSQQDQYISTEIRDDCFNLSLHLPTCLHSPITSSRISAGWVLPRQVLSLIWHLRVSHFKRVPMYAWLCYLRKQYH